jgi:hypothetical protein
MGDLNPRPRVEREHPTTTRNQCQLRFDKKVVELEIQVGFVYTSETQAIGLGSLSEVECLHVSAVNDPDYAQTTW